MFHAGGHKGVASRGRASGFSRHYPNFLSHVDWKSPLRCGILFCTFSCILFVIGVILTWLGVHDVFGESVPITGPILLAVGGLLLILALRQFYVAHVRKKAHNLALQNKELGEATIAAITDNDEHDFNNEDGYTHKCGLEDPNADIDDCCEKPSLTSRGCCNPDAITSSCGDTLNVGGYVWPPVPILNPYYSMAMMVYKDAILTYGSRVSARGLTETNSTGPVVATGVDMCEVSDSSRQDVFGGPTSPLLPQQRNTAIMDTPSTTLQQQSQFISSLPTSIIGSRQETSKIFPADYLTPHQRKHNVRTNASAGISNLPNRTAFMMLRTLELQETI
uniref:Uncharacterized protein n=1 Tax=Arion vulgaris TaxID=1028688 RepID=A0A0B6ZBQ1_9EUPU